MSRKYARWYSFLWVFGFIFLGLVADSNLNSQTITAWVDDTANNPVFGPGIGRAYYPYVLYRADGFGDNAGDLIDSTGTVAETYAFAPVYKMWSTTRAGGVYRLQFAYSADGINWINLLDDNTKRKHMKGFFQENSRGRL